MGGALTARLPGYSQSEHLVSYLEEKAACKLKLPLARATGSGAFSLKVTHYQKNLYFVLALTSHPEVLPSPPPELNPF